jgi:hypothetical protein
MHRTQIYLADDQYQTLRARARREGRSLAAVIRGILSDHLEGDPGYPERDGFSEVVGIGEGDGSRVAENYEEYLYGEDS